jgi:methionine biosynthesis protein MetW
MDNQRLKIKKYYQKYWEQRLKEEKLPPIRKEIPSFLVKYSTYGAIANQIPPKSEILDLGCGEGNVTQLFLKKGKVVGVDISQKALKKAAGLGIKTKLHDLNALPLPFKTETFDVMVLTDTLEHLIDPLGVLKESFRILARGGRVIITVPNFARLDNRLRMIWGDPIDMLHWEKYGDGREHFHWFTKGKAEHFLKLAGFEEVKFIPTGLLFGFVFGNLGFPGLARMLTVVGQKKLKR